MYSATDIQLESRLFALFVGKYDAGKSTAGASFPGNKWILDFDGRIVSLRGRSDVFFSPFQSTTRGFKEADDELEMFKLKRKMPGSQESKINMVMMDSLSMMRRLLLFDSMKFTAGIDPQTKKQKGRTIGSLSLPTTQDYGYESEAIWQLVGDGLKSLDCNVVVTAHSVDKYKNVQKSENAPVERELVGEEIYGDPKLIAVLPVMFTEIYYFSKIVDAMGRIRRFVEFTGDVARTTYPQLVAVGKVEITDKSFYEVWSGLLKGQESGKSN